MQTTTRMVLQQMIAMKIQGKYVMNVTYYPVRFSIT